MNEFILTGIFGFILIFLLMFLIIYTSFQITRKLKRYYVEVNLKNLEKELSKANLKTIAKLLDHNIFYEYDDVIKDLKSNSSRYDISNILKKFENFVKFILVNKNFILYYPEKFNDHIHIYKKSRNTFLKLIFTFLYGKNFDLFDLNVCIFCYMYIFENPENVLDSKVFEIKMLSITGGFNNQNFTDEELKNIKVLLEKYNKNIKVKNGKNIAIDEILSSIY